MSGGDLNGDGFAELFIGVRQGGNGYGAVVFGGDVLRGGDDDDVLNVNDLTFLKVDGGGTDTLGLDKAGAVIDLTTIANNKIQDIEVLDLNGTLNNSLTISAAEVLALSDTTNTIKITGNIGDSIQTTDAGWVFTGDLGAPVDGFDFHIFTNGAATMHVSHSLTHQGIGDLPTIFSIGDVVVSEEAGTVTFTITRSGDLSGTSTVDHAATSGMATAGTDFTALSGTSTFVATTATIDVTYNIIDDAVYESPETFVVTLSNATNAVIVDTTATATIVDRVDLNGLDGTDGFRILGFVSGGYSGDRVSGAGDVNRDGFADLIIGAYEAQPGADLYSGAAYVVFGSSSPAAFVDLGTLGSGGVTLDGADANDQFGRTVSAAGDINGDGYGDFIIGASKADGSANGGNNDAEATIIFGDATGALPSTFDTSVTALDGTDGFIVYGVDPVDLAGFSVASAGDINGDGYDDLIVGAHGAEGRANGTPSAGEAYIVFGGSTVGAGGAFNLSGRRRRVNRVRVVRDYYRGKFWLECVLGWRR